MCIHHIPVYAMHACSLLCPSHPSSQWSITQHRPTLRALTQLRAQSLPYNVIPDFHWWVQRLPSVTTPVSGILTRLYWNVSQFGFVSMSACMHVCYTITYIGVAETSGSIAAVAGGVIGGLFMVVLIVLVLIVLLVVIVKKGKSEGKLVTKCNNGTWPNMHADSQLSGNELLKAPGSVHEEAQEIQVVK